MTWGLWFPGALLALAALAVPVLIHLSRRTQERVTPFAALRWLEMRQPPRSRIRLTEWLLLALRLLLIGALVLLLARPFVTPWPWAASTRVLVHPSVGRDAAQAALPDAGDDADWRWLAPGYPPLDRAPEGTSVATSSLLREADAALPTTVELAVVVPPVVDGLDGERIALGRPVDWRIAAVPLRPDPPAPAAQPVRLAVRHDPGSAGAVRYLRAAVAAWNVREPGRYALDAGPLDEPVADGAAWLVWLGDSSPPGDTRWQRHGAVLVTQGESLSDDAAPAWRAPDGSPIAWTDAAGEGRWVRFSPKLTPSTLPALLDADFPERLLALMHGEPPPATRAAAEPMRPVLADAVPAPLPEALDSPLVLLIVGLFMLERLLATGARPGAAA
jgi:hypothetical protein